MEKSKELNIYLKNIVQNLPEKPGSYQYYNKDGEIIYVGKAKNLKKRVTSYFSKEQNLKTSVLVKNIYDIKYIVVETEEDALLLENNLIKRYMPRYNILLKDDKTYPYICITKEEYPRIIKTRQVDLKEGEYFGPYVHEPTIFALMEIINKLFMPRLCKTPLKTSEIESRKYKVCLNYHMHRCEGVCIGFQNKEDYLRRINNCRKILKGDTNQVLKDMEEEMRELAAKLKFEEAQQIKLKYSVLKNFQAKNQIVNPTNNNLDILYIESDQNYAYINYLHVKNGSIINAYNTRYKKAINESDEDILAIAVVDMQEKFESSAKELILPIRIDFPADYAQTIPVRGEKKKLLDLSRLNVKQFRFDLAKRAEKLNPEQRTTQLLLEIKEKLHLPTLPITIELFDNSNISGSDPVAACVVFEKLKPAKKQYKRYNIKTVEGPDDYASMKEVVYRRYSRIINEGSSLPDLIITDGGLGQMNCVREVLENDLHIDIPIAGLAKDNKHRTNELLYGFPPQVIGMKPSDELFLLLTRMQDEVHRFAIKFHREKRLKRQIASELDDIKGIGNQTKMLLLKNLKSVKRIKEASLEDFQKLLGGKKGLNIYNELHKNN